jgi:hypothetical protein
MHKRKTARAKVTLAALNQANTPAIKRRVSARANTLCRQELGQNPYICFVLISLTLKTEKHRRFLAGVLD